MEKLMQYVEQMQKEGINVCRPQFQQYYLVDMMLISKYYGLIKRLVDNDKIDLEELTAQAQEKIRLNLFGYKDNKELDTECLLMLLSIQYNPIEFLVSILR